MDSGAVSTTSRLDELRELSKQRYTSAFALAVAYAGSGDTEQALSELEIAFVERSDTMAVLGVYPCSMVCATSRASKIC